MGVGLLIRWKVFGIGAVELSKWSAEPLNVSFGDLSIEGATAFVASGAQEVVAIDIGDPFSQKEKWRVTFSGAGAVEAAEGIVYVTSAQAGIQAIDARSPQPRVLATFLTESNPIDIDVAGGVAHIASRTEGLVLADIHDLAQVRKLGALNTGPNTRSVQVYGDRAYVAVRESGVVIVDVRDPTKPVPLGIYRTPGARSVVVSGPYAYLATETHGLVILDIGDPTLPRMVGQFAFFQWAHDVAVEGNLAFVTLADDLFQVIDVGDPTLPTWVGTGPKKAPGSSLKLAGGNAYVTASSGRLFVVNISDPSAPSLSSNYPETELITDADLVKDFAVVTDQMFGVSVVDISDPSKPVKVGRCSTSGQSQALDIVGSVAYVADGSAGLAIIDIATPGNPMRLGSLDTPGNARNVVVAGAVAYVSDAEAGGLQVIDVSDPHRPRRMSQYNTRGAALNTWIEGPVAYVADGGEGVLILDVSNPARPLGLGSYKPRDSSLIARDVVVNGTIACVANALEGLFILDVSTPASPKLLRTVPGIRALGLASLGDFVLATTEFEPLHVLDLRRVESVMPRPTGIAPPSGHVRTRGDLALVTRTSDVLRLYRLSSPERLSQTVNFTLPPELVITNSPVTLRGTASSGGSISYSVVQGKGVIQDDRLILSSSGLIVVRAEQAGNGLFLPASTEARANVLRAQPKVDWISPVEDQLKNGETYLLQLSTGNTETPFQFSILRGAASLQGSQLTPTGVGEITIRAEQPVSERYLPIQTERTFSVIPNQVIKWLSPTNQALMPGVVYPLQAESDSGWPIRFRVASGPGWIEGTNLIMTNAGIVEIIAEQVGGDGVAVSRRFEPLGVDFVSAGVFQAEPHPGWETTGLDVQGRYAYLAAGLGGLIVLDVEDKSKPRLLSRVESGGAVRAVRVMSGIGCLAVDGEGLVLVDLTDPAAPMLVGSYRASDNIHGFAAVGDYVYLAAGTAGLEVVDISDPSEPARVGVLSADGSVFRAAASGDFLYVTTLNPLSFAVISVLHPSSPVLLGKYPSSDYFGSVAVRGETAFLASGSSGLRSIDVSNSAEVSVLGMAPTRGWALAARVFSNYAYVAEGTSGLEIFNVADGARPIRVGSLDGSAFDVELDGKYVYILGGSTKLSIFESNIDSPRKQSIDFAPPRHWSNPNSSLRLAANSSSGLPVSIAVVNGPGTIDGETLTVAGAGTIRLRAEQQGNDQYEHTVLERLIKVELQPQEITWLAPTQDTLELDAPTTLSAESTSGLPVTFSVERGPGIIVGNQLRITDGGPVLVRATQAGDDRFAPAFVEREFFVPNMAQSIQWLSPAGEILELSTPYELTAEASSGLNVTFSVVSGPAVISESRLTVTNAGAVCVVAEQAGSKTQPPARLTRTFNLPAVQFSSQGFWPGYQRGEAVSLAVAGHHVYVAGGGLQIFDVSNLSQPVLVGTYGPPLTSFASVRVQEPYAYLMDGTSRLQKVIILDIRNPAAPVWVGDFDTLSPRPLLDVADDRLYVPSRGLGVSIVDIRDRTKPVVLGGFRTTFGVGNTSVRVVGDHAYYGDGLAGLKIFDVSEPDNSVQLGALATGEIRDLRISEQRAYLAAGAAGLIIVDVSQPAKPVLLGSYDTSGSALAVDLFGHYACMADDSAGLVIIDVTDPASPIRTGGYDTPGGAKAVQLAGEVAYVADGSGGLQIFAVANPAQPLRLSGTRTGGQPANVSIAGRYAYVADTQLGLQILDVSDPLQPVELAIYPTDGPAQTVQVIPPLAYIGAGRMEIVDVSVPERPVPVGSDSRDAEDFFLEGNLLYTANNQGLRILDVSDPSDPWPLSSLSAGAWAHGIDKQGDYIYLACDNGLQIIDAADPFNPIRVSRLSGALRDIVVLGQYAYVVNESKGLQVIHVSDPRQPVLVGGTGPGGNSRHLKVIGSIAYVAGDRLVAYDLTQPANPVQIGALPTRAARAGLDIDGDYAFLASAAGLEVMQWRQGLPQALEFELPQELSITNPPLALTSRARSGLPVSLAVVSGPATLSDNRLTVTGAGQVVVRASQLGDARFLPISEERAMNVRWLSQTLAWVTPPMTNSSTALNWDETYRLDVISDSGLPVTLRILNGPGRIEGDQLVVTNGGPVTVMAEQRGNVHYAPARITRNFNTPAVTLTEWGQWPGYERGGAVAVQVEGDFAYLATSTGGLMIFDISATNEPSRRIAGLKVGRDATTLRVVEPRAYVVEGSTTIHILDVSSVSSPTRIGRWSIAGTVQKVDADGACAYLACGEGGLQIFEASDPASPRQIGHYSGVPANDVFVAGDRAFLAAGSHGLVTLDIRDPGRPFRLGSHGVPGDARQLVLSGSLAYVASSSGAYVVDVQDPGAPVRLSELVGAGADVVRVSGRTAFIANGVNLTTRDVGDPKRPLLPNFGIGLPQPIEDLAVVGERVFAANGRDGLRRFQASDYTRLEWLPGGPTDGYASSVEIRESYAYVADGPGGLVVLNVSNSMRPVATGAFEALTVNDLRVSDRNLAYVAAGGLYVVDVANPTHLVQQGYLQTAGQPQRVYLGDEALFVADGTSGLQLVDVSNASQPLRVSGYDTPGMSFTVRVRDDAAYVADGPGGLQIIDVSNPTHLVRLSSYDTAQPVYDLDVVEDLAYLAGGDGLELVDIRDPSQPRRVNAMATDGDTRSVLVDGTLTWLANGTNGLQIIDSRDPLNLASIARQVTQGSVERIQIRNNLVFVAEGESGLHVLSFRARFPQSIDLPLPAGISVDRSPVTVTATASSGLPVSLSVYQGPARLSRNQLILNGPGRVTVRAFQAGNNQYFPLRIERSFDVLPAGGSHAFQDWMEQHYAQLPTDQRGANDDPDQDGVPNALEVVLGTDPTRARPMDGRLPLGQMVKDQGEFVWQVDFNLNDGDLPPGLTWRLEESETLKAWAPLPESVMRRSGSHVSAVVPLSGEVRFIRLAVTVVP